MASCEKSETLADIVSDIRERADNAMRHGGEATTHNDGVAMLLRSIADRLEEAWKMEEAQWLCVAHNHAKRTAVSLAEDGLKSLDVLERACEEVLDAETLKAVVAAKRRIQGEKKDGEVRK